MKLETIQIVMTDSNELKSAELMGTIINVITLFRKLFKIKFVTCRHRLQCLRSNSSDPNCWMDWHCWPQIYSFVHRYLFPLWSKQLFAAGLGLITITLPWKTNLWNGMMGYANNLFQLTKVVLLSPLKLDFLAWEKRRTCLTSNGRAWWLNLQTCYNVKLIFI